MGIVAKQKRSVRSTSDGGRNREYLAATVLRITVVTPSFNQGSFIERTIRSVLGQEYPDLEYIIIDGGSSDGTVDIIKKYEDQLAYWTSERDKGQAEALAKGFNKATGTIYCWLNSDDILLPGALHTVNDYFQRHPGSEVVSGGAIQITEKDTLFNCWCNYTRGVRASYRRLCVIGQQGVYQPSTFWRRSAYLAVGGVDTQFQYIMDLDLFARLAKRQRFGRLPKFLAAFRIHTDAKTATLQRVHQQELSGFRLTYPYDGRFPFGPSITRWCYWFVVRVEKSILVLLKPWALWRIKRKLERSAAPALARGVSRGEN